MAEAIGLGASVVAFIGLAGHVAQGCQVARSLLDDIKAASDDVRGIRTEIQLFELTVDHLKATLAGVQDAGIPFPASSQAAVELALEYGEEAVAKLLGILAKWKDSESLRSRIKFAFGKERCAKQIARIGRANGYISTAQASIVLFELQAQ